MMESPEQSNGEETEAVAMAAFTTNFFRFTSQSLASTGSDLDSQLVRIANLRGLEAKDLREQFDHVLKARIAWWNVIERPFHVAKFVLLRGKLGSQQLPIEELKELDALLARIEFGIPVPRGPRTLLRHLIRQGTLTPREAWRLTRSLGCKVRGEELLPSPASQTSLYIGGITSAVLASVAFVCLVQFVKYMIGQCDGPGCGALGSLFLFVVLTMLASVCTTATWGRTSASKTLAALLEPRGDYHPLRARSRLQTTLSFAW